MRSPKPARAENPLGNTRRSAKAYLYLLPAFAVLAVFVVYPILMTLRMGFYQSYVYLTDTGTGFGLNSFRYVLQDPAFGLAVRNTMFIVLVGVPITIVLSWGQPCSSIPCFGPRDCFRHSHRSAPLPGCGELPGESADGRRYDRHCTHADFLPGLPKADHRRRGAGRHQGLRSCPACRALNNTMKACGTKEKKEEFSMKRKLISVSLALALGLSLAACGSKPAPAGPKPPPGNWVPFPALWNSSSGTPSPIRTT